MGVLQTAGTLAQISRYQLWDRLHRKRTNAEVKVKGYIKEVAQTGFAMIEDYYSPQECAVGRAEIDHLLTRYQDSLYRSPGNDCDSRVYGGEGVSRVVEQFYADPFLGALTREYHHSSIMNMCTLAARIEHTDGNLGSGGGWHRDSVHMRQFKTLLYLSDVDEANGPFQYLEGSHSYDEIRKLVWSEGIGYNQNRFPTPEIDGLVKNGRYRQRTLTGKQGTLVLVDTRGIHRGKPLHSGVRYAFTNYYYAKHQATSRLVQKFSEVTIDP